MTWLVPKRGGADSAMMVPAMLSPPKADGSQAWHHKQGRGVRGREVIQRGIHLVRAGRRQRHAVHEDLHTVPVQAPDLGHAGLGTVAHDGHTRRVLEQRGGVLHAGAVR